MARAADATSRRFSCGNVVNTRIGTSFAIARPSGKGTQLAGGTQGSGGELDPERLGEPAPALRRDVHGTGVADAADPAEFEAAGRKRGADCACKMRAAFTPIETRPAERAARTTALAQIDAEAE